MKKKQINFRWYDFLVAGILPVITLVMGWLCGPIAFTGALGVCVFWYLFFLLIIWVLNRNPGIAKDLERGTEDD